VCQLWYAVPTLNFITFLPAVATNNLYAVLLRKGGGAGGRKVAGEAVKKLDAFMERSGEYWL